MQQINRIRPKGGIQLRKKARKEFIIRVEEHGVVTRGKLDAFGACAMQSTVVSAIDSNYAVVTRGNPVQKRAGIIGAAVVDNDELNVSKVLRQNALYACFQITRVVIRRDADRKTWHKDS